MLYAVNELFYSIQGEGAAVGRAAYFIRLAGCNLRCSWCDTYHDKRMEMPASEIAEYAAGFPSSLAVLTGGEPLIHPLGELINALHDEGLEVAIETNGTLLGEAPLDVEWLTVSPKVGWKYDLSRLWGDEIKVVLDGVINPHDFEGCDFEHFFIQPCARSTGIDYAPAIAFVKENPKWQLSVQLHKLLDIR